MVRDLVIKNAKVVDGTGSAPFQGAVVVEGGQIVEVVRGSFTGTARRVVDAQGALLTPGFVDIHTHYDAQATWDPYLSPSCWHGCTTVVFGNCGVGFAPAAPDRHDWLIGLMEGVEDIPGSALAEGIEWQWETFPEYMDALDRMPRALDIGTQMPHGSLRAYVMGERGAANEPATAEDIDAMRKLTLEALQAGALGFSTSRTLLHKSIEGEPVPGTFATVDELFGIGRALQQAGHGVYQMAGEHLGMLDEIEWMKRLSLEIGRPVSFNLSQTWQKPELWREVLAKLEGAVEEGADLVAQVAGRSIGVLLCWQGTAHPFAGCVEYSKVGWLDWEERLENLKRPEVRAAICGEDPADLGEFANLITRGFDKMFPVDDHFDYEPEASQSVAAIAAREGRRPQEVAYDLLMRNHGTGMMYFPLFNYADYNLDLLQQLHQHPRTRMGLSDAGAHCGAICDGGMPTFMLTHWTRDRSRGPRIPLETIVHRQTQQTARLYGLMDRGVIAPGMRADLNLIDEQGLRFLEPRMAFDLPAGGRRLVQKAAGYTMTVVAGQPIFEDGEPTGAMPGKLLRGPQAPRG